VSKVAPLPDISIEIPEKVNMAWEACDRQVEEGKGDRTFLFYEDNEVTYRELQLLQNRVGNALKGIGVAKGDCILFRAPNSPELLASILATMKIGAIAVPSQTLFGEREVGHIIDNSESVLAFSDLERVGTIEAVRSRYATLRGVVVFGEPQAGRIGFADFVRDASEELECADTGSDDAAYILYTSGTTGMPKGVVRTHKDPYGSGIPLSRMLALAPDDVFMHPQEMSYAYVMGTLDAVIFTGARIALYSGRTVTERVLEYIERYRVTKLAGTPTLYRMILGISDFEKKYDLSSLKSLLSGGEPLPADTYDELKRRIGVECYDELGQTECFPVCGQRPSFPIKPGSMGKAYPGVEIGVIDDDGNPCSPNRVGHLVVKDDSPVLFVEYRKMPEKWAEVHKYPGWYDTGDLAYVDEDGYFFHAGRSDDMIKSRAYLVGPKEVEETIMELAETLEVAVVGTPDPVMGNRVKAFVTLKSGHEPTPELAQRMREHVRQRIAPYKVPKDIEFVDDLPKTPSGKLLRRELRQLEQERYNRGEKAAFTFD
jgi:acyl-coenzyme A synthetase/AMP-(fatty) acid ligase